MTLQIPEIVIVAGSDSPWTVPTAWDSITIAGVPYGTIVPSIGGKVRIRGAERFYRLDTKLPQGADGATTTYRGVAPKPFTIEFVMWTQLQYDYFEDTVVPAILYNGSKNTINPSGVQALAIDCPALRRRQIVSIEVKSIGAVVPDRDGPETFRCVVQVQEYLPPPPVNITATPSGSKGTNQPTSPGKQPNPAMVERNNLINNRRNRIRAAGGTPVL